MRIASMSKLITSIAAMQCVDRGLIGLDDDVTLVTPELKGIQLLTGFDGDKPLLRAPQKMITLRRWLSHSSGFCYDPISDLLVKWREIHHTPLQPEGPKLTNRFLYPLVFEPGDEWIYSPSIDWAGRVVERITETSLEDYIDQNIRAPLGLESMTFFLQKNPQLLARRADMTIRNEETGKLEYSDEKYWYEDPEDAMGGMAIYASPEDFFKVLRSILADDGRLLSSAMLDEFFAPQLTEEALASQAKFLSNPRWSLLMGGFLPHGLKKDHGLGGILAAEDTEEGWRRKGTMSWSGQPNLFWVSFPSECLNGNMFGRTDSLKFIDRKADLCGLYASQLKPSGDTKSHEMGKLFEKTMYQRAQAA